MSRHLGDHQPVGGWVRWIEQRPVGPDVADIVQAQPRMLEQVNCLMANLERPVIVQFVNIKPLYAISVIQTITCDYKFLRLAVSTEVTCGLTVWSA